MTYTFMKAMGGTVGTSICEEDKLDLALDIMKKAKENGVNLVLAVDTKVGDAFSNDANTKIVPSKEIPDGWEGMDIGPKSEELFANVIKGSKTILWNGPTGVFEFDNFSHGSRAVGEAIVEATKNGAFSLVGGGDSVACVNKFGLASGVSYVSTGAGHRSHQRLRLLVCIPYFRRLRQLPGKLLSTDRPESAKLQFHEERGCLNLHIRPVSCMQTTQGSCFPVQREGLSPHHRCPLRLKHKP